MFVLKALASLASLVAFLSNFTGCIVFVNQPEMPEKVRMMKR
ncbi:MAG: cyclic lactone autoinducer peptide [Clostridiaceae bacterium]|nr:cyclic lactone autoinducer peptide [Clostridiaceae bacterium]